MSKEDTFVIPSHLERASEGLKERLILREKYRKMVDNHQLRYLIISDLEGKEKTLDCKAPVAVMKRLIKSHMGTHPDTQKKSQDYIKIAESRKNMLQESFVIKISQLSRQINIMLAQEGLIDTLNTMSESIIGLLAKHYTIDEVYTTITTVWGHKVSMHQFKGWLKDNEPAIETAKTNYLLKNKDFRLAHETGRLEILNNELIKAEKEGNSDRILKILEQARKEVKGDQLKLTMDGKIDINATLHGQESVMAVSKKLPINMLVIGLVAAKKGINPENIMASLATSYYAPHNGFNGNIDPNAEIPSPVNLIKNYDWDELGRLNKKHNESIRPITDITEFKDPEEEKKAISLKQALLDSLNNG